MTTFAIVSNDSLAIHSYVQSAEPRDLARRITAAFVALNALPGNVLITSVNLAGAGDGHTFVVEIVAAEAVNVIGVGLDPGAIEAFCYMAADAFELALARSRVLDTTDPIGDEQIAGAAQGTRFMGLVLTGLVFSIVEGVLQQMFSDGGTALPRTVIAGGAPEDIITRAITIPADGVGRGYLIDAELFAAADGAGSLTVDLVDTVAGTIASGLITLPAAAEIESIALEGALDNVPVGPRSLILRVAAIGSNFSVIQARMRTDIVLASALIVT